MSRRPAASHNAPSNNAPQPPSRPSPIFPLYSWRHRSSHAHLLYIRTTHEADLQISNLRGSALGFDLEWRPTFVKGQPENPVALVQLANEHTILLIQISAMSRFPPMLRAILEDPNIIKAGVGIQYDCKKLYADYAVNTRNCCDLSLLARSVDNPRWKGRYKDPIGLARLVQVYEELLLPKGKPQRSNWEMLLTDEQQEYAANDAHSGFLIYTRLSRMANAMSAIPDPDWYSFNIVSGQICDASGFSWHPANPNYDPGPPPPPRPPKDTQKDAPTQRKAPAQTSSVTATPISAAGASKRPLRQRPRYRRAEWRAQVSASAEQPRQSLIDVRDRYELL